MIRTQIYIPEDLHLEAKMIAKRKDESLAELIRKLVRAGVKEEKKRIAKNSLNSLAKLGITAGPKDLSRNLDKYLYGK